MLINIRNICGAVFILVLISACSSTTKAPLNLSTGGNLLLETKILKERELRKLIDSSKQKQTNNEDHFKSDLKNESVLNAETKQNLAFGSGLVSSVAVLSDTGKWVSPGNYVDWKDLGFAALGFLISTDMKRHPLTYTYFFNQDLSCNDLDCHEDAFATFFQDMSDTYRSSEYYKNRDGAHIEKVEIKKSLPFILDRVQMFYNFDRPEGERDLDMKIMSVVKLDEVNDDLGIWGNENPREMPDFIGFPNLPYVETSNMMVEVSKRHPSILVYRGIASHFMKENKPCYGGFFIQNGKPIVADELNCVKSVK